MSNEFTFKENYSLEKNNGYPESFVGKTKTNGVLPTFVWKAKPFTLFLQRFMDQESNPGYYVPHAITTHIYLEAHSTDIFADYEELLRA